MQAHIPVQHQSQQQEQQQQQQQLQLQQQQLQQQHQPQHQQQMQQQHHQQQQQQQQPQQSGHGEHQNLYAQLLPIVRQMLQVLLVNDFEETTLSVTQFILNYSWQDDTNIALWMAYQSSPHSDVILRARILEAFAHWIRKKTKDLDYLVEMAQVGHPFISDRLPEVCSQLHQAGSGMPIGHYQQASSFTEVWADFLHIVVCELLGADAACLGSVLSGVLVTMVNIDELLDAVAWPSTLLALLVRKLEEMQATLSKVVMEVYIGTEFLSYQQSRNILMMFFQYYTVETLTGALNHNCGNGALQVHHSCGDEKFVESQFRVNLVDSFGCLMRLLRHLEFVTQAAQGSAGGQKVALAVDFEGVKLCRDGALCLMQLTSSDDPTLVYVLDVHTLGHRAFTLQTPRGTSMKGLLEDQEIRKVWFDPRNDIDALYHQFGIMPRGIFDLQLAEVADRRMRGLNVHFVQGLYKCLTQCPAMSQEQKVFAEQINALGKRLFEPLNGGNYEIFQARPLNPTILIYAAHDSRYMLVLYDQYVSSIGAKWVQRVLTAGDKRGRWCLSTEYVVPSSEAPEI